MKEDKIDQFQRIVPELFDNLVKDYGYHFDGFEIVDLNEMNWAIHISYVHIQKKLKIVIKQEPYYTDYGFSFFIYKIGSEQYNILYNVPHENQDADGQFLITAHADLFSNSNICEIINGRKWIQLKQIPYQK